MPFETLRDIANALDVYLSNSVTVTTTLSGFGTVLSPGEDFEFTVHITNATAETGVLLVNVRLFIRSEDKNIALLRVPLIPNAQIRASGKGLVALMRITFSQGHDFNTIKPGEEVSISFRGHALALGSTNIRAEIQADIDLGGIGKITGTSQPLNVIS